MREIYLDPSVMQSLPSRGPKPVVRTLLRSGAYLAAFLSIVVFFTVSPWTLGAFGINYETSGGSVLWKIHPGTYLACLALVLRLAASAHPVKLLWHLMTNRMGLFLFICAYGFAAAYTILFLKVPFTPMIDAFFLPIVFALLLQDLKERSAWLMALVLGLLLGANAIIALAEYLFHWHLVSFQVPEGVTGDPTRTDLIFDWRATLDTEWRATALLGHPLENGLLIGPFVLMLASAGTRWIPALIRLPLLMLELVSMVTFGSRVSLVLTLMATAALAAYRAAAFLIRRERLSTHIAIAAVLCPPLLAGVSVYLANSGFFDRLIDRFNHDAGSAETRIKMFELFRPISTYDLLFGPNQALTATWQRLEGLEFGIESFWVGLPLTYGLIVSIVIFAGLACYCHAMIKMTGRGAAVVLLVFFLTASTSASLSQKTPALGMVTAMMLLFLRKSRQSERDPNRRHRLRHEAADLHGL